MIRIRFRLAELRLFTVAYGWPVMWLMRTYGAFGPFLLATDFADFGDDGALGSSDDGASAAFFSNALKGIRDIGVHAS